MKYILFTIAIFLISSGIAAEDGNNSQKPYFSIGIEQKHELLKNAKSVRVGDSYQSVISKLGKPTNDHFVGRKENNEMIGRSVDYYAVIWKQNLVNEKHDQVVSIFFGNEDRVKSVHIKIKTD